MKETERVLKQLNKFILNHVEDYDSVDEAVEAFMKLSNEASAKGETFVTGEMTNEEKAKELFQRFPEVFAQMLLNILRIAKKNFTSRFPM